MKKISILEVFMKTINFPLYNHQIYYIQVFVNDYTLKIWSEITNGYGIVGLQQFESFNIKIKWTTSHNAIANILTTSVFKWLDFGKVIWNYQWIGNCWTTMIWKFQ